VSETFDAVDVIVAKRDKQELSDGQIDWVVDAYTRGVVADEQMSSLAMAILLNGMNRREISRWTAAMVASGERLDFSSLSRPTADKHSTGGVGDKITIPLIASSIMSKKIAEGTRALVLDVKVGSGAFMKDVDSARELARTMVDLGQDAGVNTVAVLTNMQTPLGLTAGNALEVRESVEVLAGGGPPDVVELTLVLAREMLSAAGREDVDPADALTDGRAMDVWRRLVAAQGGDPSAALPVAKETHQILAPGSGVLTELDALKVGIAAWRLGAGRARKEDKVQAGAGVQMHAKPGALLRAGDPLMTLHTDTPERFSRAVEALEGAYFIAPAGSRPYLLPLVIDRIS